MASPRYYNSSSQPYSPTPAERELDARYIRHLQAQQIIERGRTRRLVGACLVALLPGLVLLAIALKFLLGAL